MAGRPSYLDVLKQRVVVFDGAMGTSIQRYELGAADFGGEHLVGCNDHLVITRPDIIEEIHASYLEAGADVLETDTFRSNRITLKEYRLEDRVLEINRAAAALARRVADRYETPDRPRWVAGSIGPSGFLPSASDPTLGNITYEELVDVFREQAQGLLEGGADILLIETSQDLLEVKAAIAGCKQAIAQASGVRRQASEEEPGSLSPDNRHSRSPSLTPDAGRLTPGAEGGRAALQVQVTLDPSGRMLLGTDISAAATVLEALNVDVIGLNCSTGPDHMRQPVRWLCENSTLPISVIPNAGIPHNDGGNAVYPLSASALADAHEEFVTKFGVNVVGGCCGTTPDHIRAVVDRVWGKRPAARDVTRVPRLASAITAFDVAQIPAPTIIGERVNTQGSRAVKRALIADDYDAVLEVARGQQDGGAHLLDVCVALTERQDEAAQMRKLVKLLAQSVETPLVIDSTEADVVAAALRQYPGRAVINSINMENGRKRIEAVVPHAVEHGAALVAMTIDDVIGMAKTAADKLAVARKIHDIVVGEYGLGPDSLIFDALTFTLATGEAEFRRSAVETIDGIRAIKRELPGVFTTLGVSNVSFGLSKPARAVLNSVFLHHCVEAGLDTAIVHPSHVKPYAEIPEDQRQLADDLIFDRADDALAKFIQYFEGRSDESEEQQDPTADMTPDAAIHWKILHRKKEGVEELVDAAIRSRLAGTPGAASASGVRLPASEQASGVRRQASETAGGLDGSGSSEIQAGPEVSASSNPSLSPDAGRRTPDADEAAGKVPTPATHAAGVDLLNRVLLPAMKEVGDKFGAGELILPFVLQSAEVMKRAVARMETYLEKVEGQSKGVVVLATVYGDVHDIGKNLVHTILANNGYTVHDLGKQVPINDILDKAVEVNADVIGLSALLVSTSKQMPAAVQELHHRGLTFPVMCGGAAINPSFIRNAAVVGSASGVRRPASEEAESRVSTAGQTAVSDAGGRTPDADVLTPDALYRPGVWYCKDAFEGLAVVEALKSDRRAEFVAARHDDIIAGIAKRAELQARAKAARPARSDSGPSRDVPVPTPEFLGVKVLDRLPLADLYRLIELNTLYRLHWGAKNAKGEEWERLLKEFEPRLERYKRETIAGGRVRVRAAYGFWPALADGNDLVLYDPQDPTKEIARFDFPRQPDGEHLCLSDYFRSIDSDAGRRTPDAGKDVVALSIVSVGDELLHESERLMKAGDYSEGYYLHGFGVRLAEAAAEYVHRRIRKELGIGGNQGLRYSWGYPAIPDHRHHEIVFDLLPAREKLGMELTEGWALVPELATAAIVVHHPEAKYFSAVDPDDFRGTATAQASGVRRQASESADRRDERDETQRENAVSDARRLTPDARAESGEVEVQA